MAANAYPVVLDGIEVLRADLPWGYVLFGFPGKNGVTIVNTMSGDPPELRFVSPDGGLGKLSFCIGADPARAVELAMFQGKKDERTRDRPDVLWGEATAHMLGPKRNPNDPRDDGMHHVGLMLHDYVWWKGINGDEPVKPWKELPPPGSLPVPDAPVPDEPLITSEERAERVLDIEAMRLEFEGIEMDEDAMESLLQGRSTSTEFHNDLMRRTNGQHRPEFHRPGRPY